MTIKFLDLSIINKPVLNASKNKIIKQIYSGNYILDKNVEIFEKKFANEQELQFKITGRRNKYFGEWAAEKLNKKGQEIETYVNEVMRSDLKEPVDLDLIGKVQKDFDTLSNKISIDEIKSKLDECFEKAKKDFRKKEY